MTAHRDYTDEDLTAYLDAESDPATRRQIAAALADDAELRQRLNAMQFPRDAVKSAFDDLLVAAPAMPALTPLPASLHRGGWPRALMAMAACLVIGVTVGTGLTKWYSQPGGWKSYVAAYQSLYVNGTLSVVQDSESDAGLRLAALGEILGKDLGPAQTDTVLEFKRGQLLGFRGHPLVQLAYLTPLGEPVALCIMRAKGASDSAVTTTELEGMAGAQWERDGLAYLLIGGSDSALIKDAADRLAARL